MDFKRSIFASPPHLDCVRDASMSSNALVLARNRCRSHPHKRTYTAPKSTQHTSLPQFSLLAEFLDRGPHSAFGQSICTQIREFTRALKSGITAAQRGFTVTEEAYSLMDLLSSSTVDEQHHYLLGMLQLAQEFHVSVSETHNAFLKISQELGELLEDGKSQLEGIRTLEGLDGQDDTSTIEGPSITELRQDVADLTEILVITKTTATAWEDLKLQLESQKIWVFFIFFRRASFEYIGAAFFIHWRILRFKCSIYIEKMRFLEDTHPTLFSDFISEGPDVTSISTTQVDVNIANEQQRQHCKWRSRVSRSWILEHTAPFTPRLNFLTISIGGRNYQGLDNSLEQSPVLVSPVLIPLVDADNSTTTSVDIY
ncbi:hypothetical protein B0H34DRAFT_67113 [Crassisporium funariophilum]|nr:hypothetical protein B0H34DRAFT_67113 [Crassisporium funariophilum]